MDHPQRIERVRPTRGPRSWSWLSLFASRLNTSVFVLSFLVVGHNAESIVATDAIFIRRVERGTLPLRDSVSGSIVGTANNILYVDRPASARANTTSGILVLEPDGKHATRATARFGGFSGPQIEIGSGLVAGDRVIVRDRRARDTYNRLTLR